MSKRRPLTTACSPVCKKLLKQNRNPKHQIAEALEPRRLLAALTTAQVDYDWTHLKPAFEHAVAVYETVDPQFAANLEADLTARGLPVVDPQAGTLPSLDEAAKGKLHRHHHKPVSLHLAHRRHHGKDGPSAPAVTDFNYYYDQSLPNQVAFTFNEGVSCADWSNAVTVIDLNTGATVPVSSAYSSALNTVVYNLNNSNQTYNNSELADGNYAAILHGSQISDSNGLKLLGSDGIAGHDYTGDFYFYAADFNGDRAVDFLDLTILSQHYGWTSGVTYSDGDANYDGAVNIFDLNRLAQKYNRTFALLQSPGTPTLTSATPGSVQLSWAVPADPNVTAYDVYRDSTLLQANVAAATYTDTTLAAGTTHCYFVVAKDAYDNTSYPSGQLITAAAPAVTTPAFQYDTLPHQLKFTFSQSVAAANWTSTLTLLNLNTGASVSPASAAYDTTTNAVTYNFSSTTPLPNGNYTAMLHGSMITSAAGVALAGSDGTAGHDYVYNFFFLGTDFNRDRIANGSDLQIILNNMGSSGQTFSNGDANYDGSVNGLDLNLYLGAANTSLPLLGQPGGLTLNRLDGASINFSWTASTDPNVTAYDVYRFAAGGITRVATSQSQLSITDTGLSPNTPYAYFVVSKDAAGDTSYISPELLATTTGAIASPPTAPVAAQVTAESVLLTWTDSDPLAVAYNLFRDGTQIASNLTATSYLDTTVTAGATVSYYVIAINASGNLSSASTSTTVVVPPASTLPGDIRTTTMPAPTSVQATSGSTANSVVVNWQSSAPAGTTYEVDRNGVAVGQTTATNYTDSTVLPGTTYTYQIAAFDAYFNKSATASSNSVTPGDVAVPNAPLDVQVASNTLVNGTPQVTLSWVQPWDDLGVAGYNVYRGGFSPINTSLVTGTTYTDTAAAPNTAYTYYIVAVDSAGHTSALEFQGAPSISVTTLGGSVGSSDTSPNQYIPQAWQDDFYGTAANPNNSLTAVLRQRIASLVSGSVAVPPAQFWWDPTDTLISGTRPSASQTQISGAGGQYAYFDVSGGGQFQSGDPVWPVSPQSLENPDPLAYSGQPLIQTGATSVSVPVGTYGRTNGICSANNGALVWADSNTNFSKDFAAFYATLSQLSYYYANSAIDVNNPDINNPSADRSSVGAMLNGITGAQQTTIPGFNFAVPQGSTTTITVSGNATGQIIAGSGVVGDSLLINGRWYPISGASFNASNSTTQLTLAMPYVGPAWSTGTAGLTVLNWTLVPAVHDADTNATFSYQRGAPAPGSLIFQQQEAELHAALAQLNDFAPFYGQTNYGSRSATFISVATDVLNAYESVFGVTASAAVSLRNDIQNGNEGPGAVEGTGPVQTLESMVWAIAQQIYVRDPNGPGGWAVDNYGNPLTFASDTALLQALLPQRTNPYTGEVQRPAGQWSHLGAGGGAIDPEHLNEIETVLKAMTSGTLPPNYNGSVTLGSDQGLWVAAGGGLTLQVFITQSDSNGADGDLDVAYSAPPDPVHWFGPGSPIATGGGTVAVAAVEEIGTLSFDRNVRYNTSDGHNNLSDDTFSYTDGNFDIVFPAATNQNGGSDLSAILLGPPTQIPITLGQGAQWGSSQTILQWTEDDVKGKLMGAAGSGAPGWPPGADTGGQVAGNDGQENGYSWQYSRWIGLAGGNYNNDGFDKFVYAHVGTSGQSLPNLYGQVPPGNPYSPPSPVPSNNTKPYPGSSGWLSAPATPDSTNPLPLTSKMDYENTTPDTNLDGIVQVPADLSSFGNDTGVIGFQADRDAAQSFLPIFADPTDKLPVYGYLQEGAFSATGRDGSALLSDQLLNATSASAGLGGLPYADQNGLPYGFSLDSYTRVNLILNTSVNHIKRIEVIRPGGNAVVFDFPWNPNTGSFSPIGVPLGWDNRDTSRTYVLRDLTTNDPGETSEAAGTLHQYALEFTSGIVQTFSSAYPRGTLASVSNAQGVTQDLTGYLSSSTSHFNGSISGATPTADTADSPRYKVTVNWKTDDSPPVYNGRIESIDYQTIVPQGSNITPQTIHTQFHYSSNIIDQLNKSIIGGSSLDTFSYALSGNSISNNGVTTTRSGTVAGGSVTIAESSSAFVGSGSETWTFDQNAMVLTDAVTVNEGNGNPNPTATTSYAYQPKIQDNNGRYPNGAASWGEVTLVSYPDFSWVAFTYSPTTGWPTEQVTPFQSSTWNGSNEASNITQYFDYAASGMAGNDVNNNPVIAFGGQAADPMNLNDPARLCAIVTAAITMQY